MKLLITRDAYNKTETFGKLFINGLYVCETLELPWLNNQRRISCIPKGVYKVVPRSSPKYKEHLYVTNVPGRDLILIHPGNKAQDTNGCILPGMIRGKDQVLNSLVAMKEILKQTQGKTNIELEIL